MSNNINISSRARLISNGSQALDTGVYCTTNMRCEIKMAFLTTPTTPQYIGAIEKTNSSYLRCHFQAGDLNGNYVIGFWQDSPTLGNAISIPFDTEEHVFTYSASDSTVGIDGNTATHGNTPPPENCTFYLFDRNVVGFEANATPCDSALVYAKFWYGDELVRHLIAKENEYGRAGLYDLVEEEYLFSLNDSEFDIEYYNNIKYFQQSDGKHIIEFEHIDNNIWMMPAPTLAPSNTWYKGSLARNTITSISIVEDYVPTGEEDEQWNADKNDSGDITAYLIGTDLIISTNNSHFLYANPDSSFAFGGNNSSTRWSKVTSFTGLEKLLTNKVITMERMFDGLFLLEDINVGHFVTKRCTNMEALFNNCELLKEIEVGNWDVSKVTNMYAMFADCTKITKLNTKNWNPISCLNANSLCYDCYELVDIDLENVDWGSATNIGMSFYRCYKLPELKLKRSGGTSGSVWQAVVSDCDSIISFDGSNINTAGVSDLSYFCEGSANLQELIWHGLDLTSCSSYYSFFNGCTSLKQIDFTGINTSGTKNNRSQNIMRSSFTNVDIYVGSEEEKEFVATYIASGATNVTYHVGETMISIVNN